MKGVGSLPSLVRKEGYSNSVLILLNHKDIIMQLINTQQTEQVHGGARIAAGIGIVVGIAASEAWEAAKSAYRSYRNKSKNKITCSSDKGDPACTSPSTNGPR